jgi:hypothetical protein
VVIPRVSVDFGLKREINMEVDTEKMKQLEKLDELLCMRASREDSLKKLNYVIRQGFDHAGFPRRWYVQDPEKRVLEYLSKKHGRPIGAGGTLPKCGYGECHGEVSFVPHDISYSWKITQEEFDYLLARYGLKP